MARWILGLGQYNFSIVYKPRTTIRNADCLSRKQFNIAKEDIAFPVEPYLNVLRSNEATVNETDAQIIPVSEMMLPGLETFSVVNLREAQEGDYYWYEAIKKVYYEK